MLSPGLVKVSAHPDHGEPVDYQPGQLLPEWLAADLASGRALLRPLKLDGYYEVVYLPPRNARRPGGSETR